MNSNLLVFRIIIRAWILFPSQRESEARNHCTFNNMDSLKLCSGSPLATFSIHDYLWRQPSTQTLWTFVSIFQIPWLVMVPCLQATVLKHRVLDDSILKRGNYKAGVPFGCLEWPVPHSVLKLQKMPFRLLFLGLWSNILQHIIDGRRIFFGSSFKGGPHHRKKTLK